MRIVDTIEFRSASLRRGQAAARPISESPATRGPGVTAETTQAGAGSQSVTNGARPEQLDIWGQAMRVWPVKLLVGGRLSRPATLIWR
jgi:hypothetical protein